MQMMPAAMPMVPMDCRLGWLLLLRSAATNVDLLYGDPFSGPNISCNPSNDDLTNTLRDFLSAQDLMNVTKK